MSLQKLKYVTAVPFNLARNPSSTFENIMANANELNLSQSEVNRETPRSITSKAILQNFRNSKEGLSVRIIKKKRNVFKNKSDAHAFREKARLKRELLEKELLNLKIDKMGLLWENDQLKIRQSTLEEENLSLKRRLENPQNYICPLFSDRGGNLQQFTDETLYNLTCNQYLPDFEQMCEISSTTFDCNEAEDVFVCPVTEKPNELTSSHDLNAVARTICHEEIISLEEEEMVPDDVEEDPQELLIFPETWTFDDLYEDMGDHLGFYL
ncbi:hypothetical protein JTE90_013082 [Oedothorax gibbosus]|uniref:BZIP domain-containing protein n=1 Tax=Oedothorax gibbosus TaxID=931172 RepID=A0AAV6ULV2_9ARAC|nr:hypothetical protein JTE90_013082 [Oedothorax gibbosus]